MSLEDRLKGMDEKLKLSLERTLPDPALFGDELALRTEWLPLPAATANFTTHILREMPGEGLAYTTSLHARLFFLLVVGFGLSVVIGTGHEVLRGGWPPEQLEKIAPVLFGLFFAAIGGGLWLGQSGGLARFSLLNREFSTKKGRACFEQIHAVQIIHSSRKKYTVHQVNAVLKDGGRLFIVNHIDENLARKDASRIACFVGCKIWDATEERMTARAESP